MIGSAQNPVADLFNPTLERIADFAVIAIKRVAIFAVAPQAVFNGQITLVQENKMKRVLNARWAKFMLVFAMVWSVAAALVLTSPVFGKMADSGKTTDSGNRVAQCNPCNPCAAKNPCNPCAAKNPCNPCNPCGAKNPCNPCNPCGAKNPCNPCNPCGAKKKKW